MEIQRMYFLKNYPMPHNEYYYLPKLSIYLYTINTKHFITFFQKRYIYPHVIILRYSQEYHNFTLIMQFVT
jgi:hypothetical protein